MSYVDKSKKYFLNTGYRFPEEVIWAIALVKYSCAWANKEFGLLSDEKASVIMQISKTIADGKYRDLIEVDLYGTGSGTGINMNINEVIATIAEKEYGIKIHPNDDVNKSQSSNDVVPTAIRLATLKVISEKLKPELNKFIDTLSKLAAKYNKVVKTGRTHLRDALPITYGLEFKGYLEEFKLLTRHMENTIKLLRRIPLGGTAVGTGFGAPPKYGEKTISKLNEITGFNLVADKYKTRGMKLVTDLVLISAIFRALALDLWRLAQDFRLMYSGPNTGLYEIDMDIDIPGSSMMPGKKNPVTLEGVIQACIRVIGLDVSNALSNLFGEFELSLSFPVLINNLIEQCNLLSEALNKMHSIVIPSIRINIDRSREYAYSTLAILTALTPKLGYDTVTKIVEEITKGAPLEKVFKKYGISRKELDDIIKKCSK